MAGKRLSEAIEEYLRVQESRRGGDRPSATVAADNNVLYMFLRMSGDRVLTNLTPEHIEIWFYGPGGMRDEHKILSKRAGKRSQMSPPISEATHNHYRSRLKMFFSWCIQHGYMKRDVMVFTLPLSVPKQQRQRPSALTLLSLLEHADNARDRAYLAVAVNTALRSSEIRALRLKDLDLEAGWLHVTILKTKDVDSQPITSDLDRELRVWLTTYTTDLGRPLSPEDYLFPRRRGGLISHYEYGPEDDSPLVMVKHPYVWVPDQYVRETQAIIQRSLKALGLPTYKEGTHTIRRAVAMAYFQNVAQDQGDVAALRETAAFLHHSSVATTELYLGMSPEKNRRDKRLRGQPFLSAMVSQENVVPLRRTATGE